MDERFELTEREIQILLWHIEVVDHAYHNYAPEGTAEFGLRAKLHLKLLEYQRREQAAKV